MELSKLNKLTDRQIVDALVKHYPAVTQWFFFKKSYPLFKAMYESFASQFARHGVLIEDVRELIQNIYLHVITPGASNVCALEGFSFRSTLLSWLKIVTKNFCTQAIKNKFEYESLEITNDDGDRISPHEPSLEIDGYSLALSDVVKIMNMVKVPRNRKILYVHYIEQMSSAQAAGELEMTVAAYENALSRAKKEFKELKQIHLK